MQQHQPDFATTTHAKWILAGEHSVLRGKPALVFPLPCKYFKLQYYEHNPEIKNSTDQRLANVFQETIQFGLRLLAKDNMPIKGEFILENHIPVAANLGFSAALCAAAARWFAWRGLISESDLFVFARRMEDKFHGTSSGVDIAGAMSLSGVCFKTDTALRYLENDWQPKLYLSYSGASTTTAACIKIVNALRQKDSMLADHIDEQMENSVALAQTALISGPDQGLILLTQAIQQANNCFKQWGVIGEVLQQHCLQLSAEGALAVKPTGSGGGGYALSLWNTAPPSHLPFELISGF